MNIFLIRFGFFLSIPDILIFGAINGMWNDLNRSINVLKKLEEKK